jgi:hypothetical protein
MTDARKACQVGHERQNRESARLKVPSALLLRADEVIN